MGVENQERRGIREQKKLDAKEGNFALSSIDGVTLHSTYVLFRVMIYSTKNEL
jgi:hypothetical protein